MVSSWKWTRLQWICSKGLSLMWLTGEYFSLSPSGHLAFINICSSKFAWSLINWLCTFIDIPNWRVRELIYKRGYGKLNQQRTAVTDNAIVERVCNSKIVLFCERSICFNLLLICYNVVTGSGEVWQYLHGRSHPWENDSWTSLQAGKQLPVTI